jgi:hypothetical protein
VSKKKRKDKIDVKVHPSWDKRTYSNVKKDALSLTHSTLNELGSTCPEHLIQGIRGLSFVLEDIAASPGVVEEDDERDILYTAERLRIYTAALLTKMPDKKKVGVKRHKRNAKN